MRNDIAQVILRIFSVIYPFLVRTITSFIKYGIIAGSILVIYSINGYLHVSSCCWIIIFAGIIIELVKMIIFDLINKYKEDENA